MAENSSPHVAHAEPNYIAIWIWLAILTVAEIGATFLPIPHGFVAAMLVIMALTKAILVATFFMHLKFERRTLAFIAATPLVLCTFLLLMLLPDAYR